ncbi:MAG: methyltransferase domain-containing protein [Pseudomonadales bacterium]|nr:methyltransferase domain-containing protein [Pseudomonadales bacterium]
MDYKYKKENYDFWVSRLKENSPGKVCTNDLGLDALEAHQILSKLSDGASILEIGCGNGLLYEEIRNNFKIEKYVGTDFVEELIAICESKKLNEKDQFFQLDMTELQPTTFDEKFDFILSKRAIQNVIDTQLQIEAIDNFGSNLDSNGLMILVESSQSGQNCINSERVKYDLDAIEAPFHNLFFDDERIREYDFKNVELVDIHPFASDFYFITRIIYARFAKEFLKEEPNYEHPLQKIALSMSEKLSTKDYSQIKTYIFKKK